MLSVADPQSLLVEKTATEEKLALTEYELRLAQEDITRLKQELEKATESASSNAKGYFCDSQNCIATYVHDVQQLLRILNISFLYLYLHASSDMQLSCPRSTVFNDH